MSVLITDGWEAQWRRVRRGYDKLSAGYNDTELYDDDLYHFFQDAWHLKDWIKNDPLAEGGARESIEIEVKNKLIFRIAADFANGTKHMMLTRPRQENAQFTQRIVTVALGSGSALAIQERVLTLADGSHTTAESLAKKVMHEWELLLRRLKLIV